MAVIHKPYSGTLQPHFTLKMLNSVDLYLGSFLIIAGFTLSLLNLRKLVKGNTSIPAILISENVILMCIGIAFITRSVHKINTVSASMEEIQERFSIMDVTEENMDCNFVKMLKSYGPLIVSLVNSFLSLIIDNYMHYRMLGDIKKEDDENAVRDLSERSGRKNISQLYLFFKKYFSYVAIAMQWAIPVLIALSMYPMEVKERFLTHDTQKSSDFCMALVDMSNETCFTANIGNYSYELRKYIPSYLEVYENKYNASVLPRISFVVDNVKRVISGWKNISVGNFNGSVPLWRQPKVENECMKVCYVDNKSLLTYMFVVAIVCYFVPITISTVILTKLHMMDVKRGNMKTYVSRELMYNILFWTPVMFDTFLSLLLCSYSMNSMRTTMFNVVANVYQAVKNFMNTKYFKENLVEPIVA